MSSRAIGSMRLRLSSLARMVVQRQTAASSPTRPWISGQHFSFTSLPIITCTRPLSRSTHAPSFRASIGHCPTAGDGGGDGPTGGAGGATGATGGDGAGNEKGWVWIPRSFVREDSLLTECNP
ncbi:unnamed protein product [Spirodela intermedia]|uniref:Uncharacterized protein n=1 Tax=Spirodela intermedia TaxID=51605 RepID=A0A7I8IUZ3_SPIIN|nr:unnamed protein product [Spirodela intermedia]CAA6661442.1 unnamed protein product [Spirodela intermedia]